MDDQPTERKQNFIDADFARHETGENIQASNDFINNPTPTLNPTYDSSLLDDTDEEDGHGIKEEAVGHQQE